jgi:hypothetical protein
MKPSELRSAEDAIFKEYKSLHPGSSILPDGVADPEVYLKEDFRVLFVLKEGNDAEGKWTAEGGDLRGFAKWGGCERTWQNLARWAAIARRVDFDPAKSGDQEWRATQLRHCAFVNLKKIPGGGRADDDEVRKFALDHADLLSRQMSLYEPDLTLACGHNIFGALEEIFGGKRVHPKEDVLNGFWFFKDVHLGSVVDFYHPQYAPAGGASAFIEMLRPNLQYHFPDRYPNAF